MKPEIYKIDASGQALGRVASLTANALLRRYKVSGKKKDQMNSVVITNAGRIKLNNRRLETKSYVRYSGYPGGLKQTPLARLIQKRGVAEPLRLAVKGMLPGNKLRSHFMKHLIIEE